MGGNYDGEPVTDIIQQSNNIHISGQKYAQWLCHDNSNFTNYFLRYKQDHFDSDILHYQFF